MTEYMEGSWGESYEVGDILFTVHDVPVVVRAITRFEGDNDYQYVGMVDYLGIEYPKSTVGIESLNDLAPETHAEFMARVNSGKWEPNSPYPKPRNVRDFPLSMLHTIPGIATRESLRADALRRAETFKHRATI